jgi:ribonucleoside-diphosphate reductase alpha chain
VTAQEIDPEWHIRIQAAFQKYTDNAVSKTINFSNAATREDIAQAYLLAYELNCKGLTVYRDGSRNEQVLSVGAASAGKEQVKGHLKAAYNTIVPRPRPEVTMGVTEKIKIGCGNLYVSVNADEEGICEVFTNTGRAGGCASQSEATARLISIALRSGIEVETLIEQMRGIRCSACIRRDGVNVTSCPDAISRVIQKYMDVGVADEERRLSPQVLRELSSVGVKSSEPKKNNAVNGLTEKVQAGENNDNACPECGMPISHESGCIVCIHCGYSKCG